MFIPDDSDKKIEEMEDTREIGDIGPDQTFPFSNLFLWADYYDVFDFESGLGLSLSLAATFLLLLAFFLDIVDSLLAILMVGFTMLGELSLLYFWGEHLNAVTITSTIMAIGVSVDYVTHFIHAFRHTSEEDNKERVIKTLGNVGISVFNGATSTFIAIIPIFFGRHYIFEMTFKIWFSIIVFSFAHAMVLTPVLMSFVGRKPKQGTVEASVRETVPISLDQNAPEHIK